MKTADCKIQISDISTKSNRLDDNNSEYGVVTLGTDHPDPSFRWSEISRDQLELILLDSEALGDATSMTCNTCSC